MKISPDSIDIWGWGPININGTLIFTWIMMLIVVTASWLITRKITVEGKISRWQLFLETGVGFMRRQVREVIHEDEKIYLYFLGTLFIFISASNLLSLIPGYTSPTGSLSTTSALALCVFFAVPVFGIWERGFGGYFRKYVKPYFFMLPFHVIGELSRTLALAVRLFGNVMSGTLIVAILISVVPLIVPIIMQALGLLIGQIQAYIFTVLAAVYIASAIRAHKKEEERAEGKEKNNKKEDSKEDDEESKEEQ